MTHYFGTYASLVEQTLAEEMRALQELVLDAMSEPGFTPMDVVVRAFEVLRRPPTGRLIAWALLTGHMEHVDFFPSTEKGLRRISNVLHAVGFGDTQDNADVMVVEVWCLLVGYAAAAPTLWASLDRAHDATRDQLFECRLRAHLSVFRRR